MKRRINNFSNDFQKFARSKKNISSLSIHKYSKFHNDYISPTVIEERSMNVTSLDVFSRLMMDRIIFLGTAIDSDVANIIQAQLLFLESSNQEEDINIYLNTPGGEIYSGLGIIDVMNLIKPDISCNVTGLAASMGAVILSSGTKGKRYALKHSRVMIHQPLGSAYGQSIDMEIEVKEILKLKKELYQILAEQTGQTYKQIEKDSDRDYWMTAEESKKYGIIDEVL